jgi:thymidine phosphorylase
MMSGNPDHQIQLPVEDGQVVYSTAPVHAMDHGKNLRTEVPVRSRALDSGRAWLKFQAICEAQGGMREPPTSTHRWELLAAAAGTITSIDNRRLARLAKLASAPMSKASGIRLCTRVGDPVEVGQPIFELHTESAGEIKYARRYLEAQPDIIRIGELP